MSELGPIDLGSDIDPLTGNFIKKTEVSKPVEAEMPELDIGQSLADGTADEYRQNVGALPIEDYWKSKVMREFGQNYQKQKKTDTAEIFQLMPLVKVSK